MIDRSKQMVGCHNEAKRPIYEKGCNRKAWVNWSIMRTVEIRYRIHNVINEMPREKLQEVLYFLEDLQRSSEDETAMLINDPEFIEDYQEAKEDICTGKTISFDAIRRDV
jgi:hypothetical protein